MYAGAVYSAGSGNVTHTIFRNNTGSVVGSGQAQGGAIWIGVSLLTSAVLFDSNGVLANDALQTGTGSVCFTVQVAGLNFIHCRSCVWRSAVCRLRQYDCVRVSREQRDEDW